MHSIRYQPSVDLGFSILSNFYRISIDSIESTEFL